jgi:formamidopyrimidine-DNA glycosylase
MRFSDEQRIRIDRLSLPPLLRRRKVLDREVKVRRIGRRIPGGADVAEDRALYHCIALAQAVGIRIQMCVVVDALLSGVELIDRQSSRAAVVKLTDRAVDCGDHRRPARREDVDGSMQPPPAPTLDERVAQVGRDDSSDRNCEQRPRHDHDSFRHLPAAPTRRSSRPLQRANDVRARYGNRQDAGRLTRQAAEEHEQGSAHDPSSGEGDESTHAFDNDHGVPELPDVAIYLEALERHIGGRRLATLRLASPFVLRTVTPSPAELDGRVVTSLRRIGKRIVIGFAGELFVVIHLMIAGRLRWQPRDARLPGRITLGAFDFENGTLVLTEAGSKRRASIHIVKGEPALAEHDPGGLEPLETSLEEFRANFTRESHTLKRALTDPKTFSGIGNAYSDEILHHARLSPVQMTTNLSDAEIERLYLSTRAVLTEWVERLRENAGDGFPEKVTAFRPEMKVHGRYGKLCPDCSSPVQRIVYAENETNYCARCQTGGRLLADRALSRLLKSDWPKSIDDL